MSEIEELENLIDWLEASVNKRDWEGITAADEGVNRVINELMKSVSLNEISPIEAEKVVASVKAKYLGLQSELEAIRQEYSKELKTLNQQQSAVNHYLKGFE